VNKPVAILDPHWRTLDELFAPGDLAALGELCDLKWATNAPLPRATFEELLPEADFLISATPVLGATDFLRAPKLRAVIEVSGSFPGGIDYAEAFRRGIEVLCCAPGFRESVAEMAVGLALAGARGIVTEHEAFRRGDEHWLGDNEASDFTLYGQTIGFVGLGSIARETIRLLAPYAPKFLAYDPWLPQTVADDLNVELCSLETLATRSRCLFVTAAPTHENRGLLNKQLIGRMPRGALLVLVSRAHLIDFEAAIAAAQSGAIRLAVDVFPNEPVEPGSALRRSGNVIFSPHRAAAVKGGRQLIGRLILADIRAMLAGSETRQLQRADRQRVAHLAGVQGASNVQTMAARRAAEAAASD
jgi:phosphoglycerate dehydrogenase-like enzyme